jgi:hypothetical protein
LLRVGLQLPEARLLVVTALVDTGAPLSVFDGRLAVRAGLSLNDLRAPRNAAIPLRGLTGGASRAYVHEASLYVGESREHAVLNTVIAFTDPNDPPLSFNLLGRRGFLDQLLVGLDEGGSHSALRQPAIYLRVL